ncbi:MAG: DUF962 domain-containing protein [Gammaproteobacteria bacterium]|nr:DUF962 domain-containing protein [Gammaproteobacteria bacterium]MBU1555876.1 DUF962 domain-containing protein [Gammaproteobacteria bacterium]MBU2071468.1 DUF962 domain-containing protein [Gammaproteobacteria bacterium]MBU2182480.1 DUF962 domain-containing protein [Gammaproteobacteria bacterium]MBU2205862.1 DUF962 domain-containing protein [Gammaproteobacteria bacterium]
MTKFSSFAEFYPYYLTEHRNPICRALHYIGSGLVITVLLFALLTQQWRLLWLLPLIGYGFAWLGHLVFEHNKPATFKYPFYSLAADWVMLKDFLTGQLKRKLPG